MYSCLIITSDNMVECMQCGLQGKPYMMNNTRKGNTEPVDLCEKNSAISRLSLKIIGVNLPFLVNLNLLECMLS